jgi:hypothetical protein
MKIKVEKDNIVKEVESFVLVDYISAGWKKVEEKKKDKKRNEENDPLKG